MTAVMQELVAKNTDEASLPLAQHDLAYLLVRVVESFLYIDIITGEEPDPAKVRQAVAALLRSTVPTRRARP